MFPGEFDYYRAESIDEALELWDQFSDHETKYLAGGHSLLPMMKTRLANPDVLIDVGQIGALDGIEQVDSSIRIGAMTRYADVSSERLVQTHTPIIAEAAASIGDRQVRNRGTFGGNIAHADPASDLPAAVLISEATVFAHGPDGERQIDISEFFVDMYTSALTAGELLTHVDIPPLEPTTGAAYVKRPSPSSGYAIVGVGAILQIKDGVIIDARVGANGATDHAVRLEVVEEQLIDRAPDDDVLKTAAERATDGIDLVMVMDDIQASAEFRSHLLRAYTERALFTALDRFNDPDR